MLVGIEARKTKGFSQHKQARLAKVRFTNIGKYERGEATPASDLLNRNAKVLKVTTDFLMNGTMQEKSAEALSDEEKLAQFCKIKNSPVAKKVGQGVFGLLYI